MSASSTPDDERALAESLRQLGAEVGISTTGWILRVDCRPVAQTVDDDWIGKLRGSSRLRELHLAGSKITPACTDDLLSLKGLRVLDVENTALDDAVVERLVRLPNLNLLLVRGAQVSTNGIRAIRKNATRVRIVG
jgi:hypothetical protein